MDQVKLLRQEIERQYPGLPFHESVATFILGQWPRVSIHDPATYIKSMARVLSQHTDAAVVACADPAMGIARETDKLPTMKILHDYLAKQSAQIEISERYKAMPKAAPAERRIIGPPPRLGPNLFIAENINGYDRMVEKSKHPTAVHLELFRFERRVCSDGETRLGIWVPLGWWEDGGHQADKTWQRPPAQEIVEEIIDPI